MTEIQERRINVLDPRDGTHKPVIVAPTEADKKRAGIKLSREDRDNRDPFSFDDFADRSERSPK